MSMQIAGRLGVEESVDIFVWSGFQKGAKEMKDLAFLSCQYC